MNKPLLNCDLVLEGGGVKGLGLVGALDVLAERGYRVRRVAGTSAGAIVGALVAAGMPTSQLRQIMSTLDYRQFRDPGLIDRLGLPGQAISLWFEQGIYEGAYLHEWLTKQLAELGVHTFADLSLTEPWTAELPPERRYKLVVVATDVTRGRLVRLPWDYRAYGLAPEMQSIADAVRASMSVPFFYEPTRLGQSKLVDGAVLSNFPIDLFDDAAEWPTFGIKLSAKPEANFNFRSADSTVDFAQAILTTMINAHDQMHLDDPSVISRTIFVDTAQVKTLDFDITAEQQELLYQNGRLGAEKFLDTWDFAAWRTKYAPASKKR
jgi:NTE family protein